MATTQMTMTTTSTEPLRAGWAGYAQEWRHAPGRVLYLLVAFVIGMLSLTLLAVLFWLGVGLAILFIGIPIVVVSLFLARGFGVADRHLLSLTGLPRIQEPDWTRHRAPSRGFWATVTGPLRNGHYWAYLIHGMLLSPLLSIVTFALTVAWVSISLGGLTYWFWGAFIPRGDGGEWGQYVAAGIPWLFGGWSGWSVEVILYLAGGVLFSLTLPWVMSGLSRLHHGLAEGLLGRWPSDDVIVEARAEAQARSAAVHAEGTGLRRLERDIHDGPQQRLVRLQMDLAALERRAAAGDTDAAAQLAREARGHAKAALDELRALSSGVAPPLLQDRGLAAALTATAAASALPVTVEIDPRIDDDVPPEIARTVYFVVAELLTNAVKHADASSVILRASIRDALVPPMLDVWVIDDGSGGADVVAGHGLQGLRDRLAGLRGVLTVHSPLGGPTMVGAHVPLVGPAGAAEPR